MNGPVENQQFVNVWQAASSPQEVASLVGSTVPAVKMRAHRFRQKGVALKRFSATRPKKHWDLDVPPAPDVIRRGRREVADKRVLRGCRFNDAEWTEVKRKAAEAGMGVAAWVRKVVVEA